MSHQDVYQIEDFARFYDWSYSNTFKDVLFHVELVRRHGTAVLEVACGTGRVAIELARQGFTTAGVDLSEAMLNIARAKLEREPVEIRRRVSLHHGDMRTFDLGKLFPAVLIPNASIFHLDSEPAILQCLSRLHAHTAAGGIVVVDAVSPNRMANQIVDREMLIHEGINPFTRLRTKELNRKLLIDRKTQFVRVEHVYIEYRDNREKRYVFQQDYHWIEEHQGVDLLRRAGFTDVRVFGDYDQSRFSAESPRLILTGRRPSVASTRSDLPGPR